MKFSSLLALVSFSCVSAAMLGACASHCPTPVAAVLVPMEYWRVVSSDFEGRRIAEFIAEGRVRETEDGYCFRAVQRRIFTPYALEFHYPLGRPVTVNASNVVVTPATKPLWLENVDEGSRPVDENKGYRIVPDGKAVL